MWAGDRQVPRQSGQLHLGRPPQGDCPLRPPSPRPALRPSHPQSSGRIKEPDSAPHTSVHFFRRAGSSPALVSPLSEEGLELNCPAGLACEGHGYAGGPAVPAAPAPPPRPCVAHRARSLQPGGRQKEPGRGGPRGRDAAPCREAGRAGRFPDSGSTCRRRVCGFADLGGDTSVPA